ncbi:hypothetical protein [Pedobacter psychrodurus]|uniref:hypothetical protein n=1 Tax=Pedobacter psychrodurus TaxID=2530456 RepID=UPI00293022C1|nr:hypothetical protein [Pedobacter psychrodurus]
MKKQTIEPDFIGGQGALTKEEEIALTKYFANKKSKNLKPQVETKTALSSKQQFTAQ